MWWMGWDGLGQPPSSATTHPGRARFQRLMSLFPNWVGGGRRRAIAWDGERLLPTTPPILAGGTAVTHRLVWERVSRGEG
jgi:hypothetical protein